jgi:hypothetical protein
MYLNNFMVFNGCMVSVLRHGDEGLPETLSKISSHAMKNLTDKKTPAHIAMNGKYSVR